MPRLNEIRSWELITECEKEHGYSLVRVFHSFDLNRGRNLNWNAVKLQLIHARRITYKNSHSN